MSPVFIAHRGNYDGIQTERENTIDYLRQAYNMGFGVECDLQVQDGVLYFGHDEPQETADWHFLLRPYVFCHAKTVDTMQVLMNGGAHCFWHEEDQLTLTNRGLMWCYPGVYPVHAKSIWLDLQGYDTPCIKDTNIFGVCGDNYNNVKWT